MENITKLTITINNNKTDISYFDPKIRKSPVEYVRLDMYVMYLYVHVGVCVWVCMYVYFEGGEDDALVSWCWILSRRQRKFFPEVRCDGKFN
mgnify:CR=1 FL=1